jgi:hypothetical protein
VKSGWLQELLRWSIAAAVAIGMTLAIFIAMTRMIDGSDILATIVRIFPLSFASPEDQGACEDELPNAVTIGGSVGYYGAEGFEPLIDAEIFREGARGGQQSVGVSADGVFRFVTAFASEAPTRCPRDDGFDPNTAQQLRLRAPGCTERSVPVTRAWLPHRVLLECSERG